MTSPLQAYHEGAWVNVELLSYGSDPVELAEAIVIPERLTMTVSGSTFSPAVELVSGSDATVTWWNQDTNTQIGTGITPTLSISGVTHVGMEVSAPADVLTLNFGFNSADDAGTYNIGSGYNRAAQPITGISGLATLTGLRRFLAANGPLTGHLDFTGLSNLEYIECFQANVNSVNLAGCASLIRLCLEQNNIAALDLNPVRHSLYDLRAAEQGSPSLTFTTLTGPMDHLYHYCLRNHAVINIVPMSQLPVVEQYWCWDTAQTTCDSPISSACGSFLSYENSYDQASVDRILIGLRDATSFSGGVCQIGGAVPSSAGASAATTLRGRGWTVTTS